MANKSALVFVAGFALLALTHKPETPEEKVARLTQRVEYLQNEIAQYPAPKPESSEHKAARIAYENCMSKATELSYSDEYATGNLLVPEAPGMFSSLKTQNLYSLRMGCGFDPGGPPIDSIDLAENDRAELAATVKELAALKAQLSTPAPEGADFDTTMARLRAQQGRK
jgi:hypothetical protein